MLHFTTFHNVSVHVYIKFPRHSHKLEIMSTKAKLVPKHDIYTLYHVELSLSYEPKTWLSSGHISLQTLGCIILQIYRNYGASHVYYTEVKVIWDERTTWRTETFLTILGNTVLQSRTFWEKNRSLSVVPVGVPIITAQWSQVAWSLTHFKSERNTL